ncbi:hypothetical protein SAMN05660236_5360 [Ohtaekwangia koreensis]|uniref:Uncharacterized protein n=1 Tax=Ohtaekwangia koreensis TaxID=688867 RepID=A0A1T5MG80_9BACT|nr:hypothetical protein SAMN05660236_5360 [Ohtaekwangia koreensis]
MELSDETTISISNESEDAFIVQKAKIYLPLLSYNISLMAFKVVKIFFQV